MKNKVNHILCYSKFKNMQIVLFCWYQNLLGTRGPIGLDPGGQDFRQPRTPLQSAPTFPTIQC